MLRYNQKSPPSEAIASIKEAEANVNPEESFNKHKEVIDQRDLGCQARLPFQKLFVGATPYLIGSIVVVVAAAAAQLLSGDALVPNWTDLGIGVGAAAVFLIVFFVLTRMMSRKSVVAVVTPLQRAMDAGRIASENLMSKATMEHDLMLSKAKRQNKTELQAARDRATPILDKATKKRDAALQSMLTEQQAKNAPERNAAEERG